MRTRRDVRFVSGKPLKKCPTCLTPVNDVSLGLRNYGWVNDLLPGKVAPTDIDFMLERKGHVLVLEFKSENGYVPKGQAMTFRTLRKMGVEVWVVKGDGPMVDVDFGDGLVSHLPVSELAAETVRWYSEAGEDNANQ